MSLRDDEALGSWNAIDVCHHGETLGRVCPECSGETWVDRLADVGIEAAPLLPFRDVTVVAYL